MLHEHASGARADAVLPYDPALVEVISAAASRFHAQLDQATPFMAPRVRAWLASRYGSVPLADVFQLPASFPMLLLPWTLEKAIRGVPDTAFQTALAFSTINGYHYIRFIDDLMDGDAPLPTELLPILGFFYFQAHSPYQRYFSHAHPFWDTFAAYWFACADVTARDATLESLDHSQFVEVAAKKTSAAKIPLAAVCWKYDCVELFESWSGFHDVLGCWYQMSNDLRDWKLDLRHRNATFFLSEAARRKAVDESIAEWVVREGYAWAVGLLDAWMAEMKDRARQLDSPPLLAYLDARERAQWQRDGAVLEVLPRIAGVVSRLKARLGT